MNFNPGRQTFVAEGPPAADPRTELVCDIAEQIYGAGWRYSIATEFAIGPDEIEDWIERRATVPDFLIAGLLRQVRVRAALHAAVAKALAEDAARAPDGDYSFPDALARNARVMIRECDAGSLLYDKERDEYYVPSAANRVPTAEATLSTQAESNAPQNSDVMTADESIDTALDLNPARSATHISIVPKGYREPRVDVRDRI